MDLMEILKALFGDESLTFEQFAEKVNNAADVKLGNLAGGQYIEKEKYDDVSKQLETANANLDMSKIAQGEDGKITGLDEQLGELKTSKPFLFKSDEPRRS